MKPKAWKEVGKIAADEYPMWKSIFNGFSQIKVPFFQLNIDIKMCNSNSNDSSYVEVRARLLLVDKKTIILRNMCDSWWYSNLHLPRFKG